MSSRPASTAVPRSVRVWPAALVIVGVTLLVYANSLSTPFVFDDLPATRDNPSIRSFRTAFSPPPTAGSAAGRPLINLSFALNHALSGDSPVGYHALNLLIHASAALALFGFVRRTLLLSAMRGRWGEAAVPVAFCSALLWAVHPLLTESVTCIAQRTESLAGLWLLLMFYCLARAQEPSAKNAGPSTGSGHSTSTSVARHERRAKPEVEWLAGGFGACLLGVFTKEITVVGPVLAAFYYALLVDSSWREVFARRGRFLALLALTWIPLAVLVLKHGPRYGAGTFEHIGVWEYALTQCRAILLYLKLSFWPHPLVLDYGTPVNRTLGEVWLQALALVALLGLTVFATLRKWPAAFAGLWCFAILAPSSSVLPLFTQTIAEHRMYLPLAGVIVLVVGGAHLLAGRRALMVLAVAAIPLALLTVQRNRDYATPLAIWRDTVAKAPDNPRAHTNVGNLLDEAGQPEAALQAYRDALRAQPDYALAHANLTNLLVRHGRVNEVTAEYAALVQREPGLAVARLNLGNLYALQERWAEAEAQFKAALQIDPTDTIAFSNLGSVLFNQDRPGEAAAAFAAALPRHDSADLRVNLGMALAASGQPNAALEHFLAAAQMDPTRAEVPVRIGVILLSQGRRPEAVARFREALRLDPNQARARELLRELGEAVP